MHAQRKPTNYAHTLTHTHLIVMYKISDAVAVVTDGPEVKHFIPYCSGIALESLKWRSKVVRKRRYVFIVFMFCTDIEVVEVAIESSMRRGHRKSQVCKSAEEGREGWRDGGMEGWMDGWMEGWRLTMISAKACSHMRACPGTCLPARALPAR